MKVTINIDCTPEEARTFLGLPDVQPMQAALMQQLQDQMSANLKAMDPETMMNTWLPLGMQGIEQFQKLMWSQMSNAMGGTSTKDAKK
ncbi:DUF6489 family protein [Niveispirillum cyanobacteriorum]|uniref:Uncharacterized protein n=1 Tax=Niveispirillum cyanobacteriorum TaxID=1612173 RepID=A0A2K9NCK3_9PROT|nr:DUF6489 family protein [Niveispirillum cyanobacteriorum]AUN30871.1 hypothetical protein C0V82_11955 [Niveispirillum cyanobacteriorum]GGE80360.1 hypothetical protein GCM10011317_41950 [Niveispirillum cyanobacteriorum]